MENQVPIKFTFPKPFLTSRYHQSNTADYNFKELQNELYLIYQQVSERLNLPCHQGTRPYLQELSQILDYQKYEMIMEQIQSIQKMKTEIDQQSEQDNFKESIRLYKQYPHSINIILSKCKSLDIKVENICIQTIINKPREENYQVEDDDFVVYKIPVSLIKKRI